MTTTPSARPLLSTLRTGLGPAFTVEVEDAWAAAFSRIAETMREGAELREAPSIRTDVRPRS